MRHSGYTAGYDCAARPIEDRPNVIVPVGVVSGVRPRGFDYRDSLSDVFWAGSVRIVERGPRRGSHESKGRFRAGSNHLVAEGQVDRINLIGRLQTGVLSA